MDSFLLLLLLFLLNQIAMKMFPPSPYRFGISSEAIGLEAKAVEKSVLNQ